MTSGQRRAVQCSWTPRSAPARTTSTDLDTTGQASLYDRALGKALSDARQKAQAIASAAGLRLGTALKVHEGGNAVVEPMFAEAARSSTAPPIEAGTQGIQASVTVTYSAGG